MFNPMKKNPLMMSLLAGAAGVIVSGSAAMAAPAYVQQGIEPQAQPVTTNSYVYSRTEVTTRAPQYQYMDNDDAYQATTTGMRKTDVAVVTNPDNIRYLSGGIGHDEQMQLKAAEAEYPVKLTFANSNGAYMSDVDVTVKNSAGETVLGLTTDGPVLLMDLEPGTYTLSADSGSEVKTQKLNVSDSIRSYTLHFKAQGTADYAG